KLLLRLVDAGDVLEGDLVAAGLVLARARAAELAEHALHARTAPHREIDQADEENRRTEADEEVLPPRRTGVERLRVDDDALLLEQGRERVRVRERRDLRLELLRLLRARVALGKGERSLHGGALRRDRSDVRVAHLLEEEGAVRHADARRALRRARCRVEVDEKEDGDPADPPADADAWPLRRLRQARPTRRVGAHIRIMPLGARPRLSRARRSWRRRGPCPRRRATRARCERPAHPCRYSGSA